MLSIVNWKSRVEECQLEGLPLREFRLKELQLEESPVKSLLLRRVSTGKVSIAKSGCLPFHSLQRLRNIVVLLFHQMSPDADVEVMRVRPPVDLSNIEVEQLLVGFAQ